MQPLLDPTRIIFFFVRRMHFGSCYGADADGHRTHWQDLGLRELQRRTRCHHQREGASYLLYPATPIVEVSR